MTQPRNLRRGLMAAVSISIALSGCGGSDAEPNESDDPTTTTAASNVTTTTSTAAASTAPSKPTTTANTSTTAAVSTVPPPTVATTRPLSSPATNAPATIPAVQEEFEDDFTGDGAPPECIDAALAGTPMPDWCSEYGY